MTSLRIQNQVLFYKLCQDHLKEMFPVICTPTEGDAIQNFSQLFRKPEGCFLNIAEPDDVETSLNKWGPSEDVDIIVRSDAEQILGAHDYRIAQWKKYSDMI